MSIVRLQADNQIVTKQLMKRVFLSKLLSVYSCVFLNFCLIYFRFISVCLLSAPRLLNFAYFKKFEDLHFSD